MSECVKVLVRCRPLNDVEVENSTEIVLTVDRTQRTCILRKPGDRISSPRKVFTFDGVYEADATNDEIYTEFVSPLVESVLEGYNGCVFAYGQTSCGKTFSMQGLQNMNMQRGIINRAIDQIFENIQVTDVTYYTIRASYLEIYNEEIRDLLNKQNRYKLDIKEHPEKGVYVRGLSSVEVTTSKRWKKLSNTEAGTEHWGLQRRLNLVDLAGSERQRKAKQGEERLKEATKINLSLSALGNVISALVNEKCKHIPVQSVKTNIGFGENNYHETLSTLRYANRAKNIKNRPRINEDPKDALIRQYQKEIKMLRQILVNQMRISDQARLEYEQKISELQHRFDYEHVTNERLQSTLQSLKNEFDHYRLRSEYSLQRLQAENKARLASIGPQNNNLTGDKSESSSTEDFPVSSASITTASCSSCDEFFWSERSFDRSVLNSEASQPVELENSHLWSSNWLRSKKPDADSEIGEETTYQSKLGDVESALLTEEETEKTNLSLEDEDHGGDFPKCDRESGDGVSDTPSTPELAKTELIISDQPDSLKSNNNDPTSKQKMDQSFLYWLLNCGGSCFGENAGDMKSKYCQTSLY
eukprot:gene16918-18624_t